MWRVIVKRLFSAIPMLCATAVISFFVMKAAPGDMLSGMRADPQVSPATIAQYEKAYHLDAPSWKQFAYWFAGLCKGDLGYSFTYKASVSGVIVSRAANTLILSFMTIVATWVLVIPIGLYCARKKNGLGDRLVSLLSFVSLSTPGFFLAVLVLFVCKDLSWFPLGGMRSISYDSLPFVARLFDVLRHAILPVAVLTLGSLGSLVRMMRANVLEELGKTYVKALRAKGIGERRVLYVHVLRNALNPMITVFGYQFASLLSGAALVEIVFSWPGLGRVMLDAVQSADYYLVMGGVLMSGVLLVLGNLIADILLAWADPRIREAG
jgi:peptide/nickel transport system permease protein